MAEQQLVSKQIIELQKKYPYIEPPILERPYIPKPRENVFEELRRLGKMGYEPKPKPPRPKQKGISVIPIEKHVSRSTQNVERLSRQLTGQLPKQLQRQEQLLDQITKQIPIQEPMQIPAQIPTQRQLRRQLQRQEQITKQITIQKQIQITKPKLIQRILEERPIERLYRARPRRLPRRPAPFAFPMFRLEGLQRYYKMRKGIKIKARYEPSLVAIAKRIFATKPERLMEEGRLTGVGIRPIPKEWLKKMARGIR